MESRSQGVANARMNEAVALASRGLHAEALEAYMWCFDQGHLQDPSFVGVRLSFLLGHVMDLARVYSPALDELRRRRAAAESRILAGESDVEIIHEFGAINRSLSDSGRTLRLFDELLGRAGGGEAMAAFLQFAVPLLVEARRYEDVLRAAGDAPSLVNGLIEMVEGQLEFIRGQYEKDRLYPELVESLKNGVVEEGGAYYEALLGSGREEEALRCADRLLAMHSAGRSFATLIEHAVRSGAISAARGLARRGLQVVPEPERVAVMGAAEKIPGGLDA